MRVGASASHFTRLGGGAEHAGRLVPRASQ